LDGAWVQRLVAAHGTAANGGDYGDAPIFHRCARSGLQYNCYHATKHLGLRHRPAPIRPCGPRRERGSTRN